MDGQGHRCAGTIQDVTEPRSWFLLLHVPGPAIPDGGSAFDHPDIAEHYAFLQRRAADGTLIAAGPLADQDGAGATVLAAESLAEAERLATHDDQAVMRGVLTVRVRPWTVMLAPIADNPAL